MTAKLLTETVSCEWLRTAAATVPAGQACVELGVYQGGSLRYICDGASQGHGAQVFGVDAWGIPAAYTKPHLRRAYGRQNMAIAERNAPTATLIRAVSQRAALYWTGPPIGLLHIDGTHDYRNCMTDFKAWEPHLASDATIAWDDYWEGRFPGVIMAVDELVANGTLTDFQRIGHHFAVTKLA